MRISDWSSDVCSSDRPEFDQIGVFLGNARPIPGLLRRDRIHAHLHLLDLAPHLPLRPVQYDLEAVCAILQRHVDEFIAAVAIRADRKGVAQGKSVSVRVDLGGGRTLKKKNKNK